LLAVFGVWYLLHWRRSGWPGDRRAEIDRTDATSWRRPCAMLPDSMTAPVGRASCIQGTRTRVSKREDRRSNAAALL